MADLAYNGTDPAEALAFFCEHKREMRALRRVVVGEEGATVKDINGKSMHLSGVTLGRPELEDLLRMAGASYDPKTLNEPPARAQKSKEFQVVKQDPWGQDRVM